MLYNDLKDITSLFRSVTNLTGNYSYILTGDEEQTTLEFLSDSIAEITGYTNEELANPDEILKIIHPDDRTVFLRHFHRVNAGTACSEEYRILRKDGRIRWVLDHAVAQNDQDRRLIYGSLIDITVAKQKTEERRRTDLKIRLLIEKSPLGICFIDTNGRIQEANQALLDLLGSPSLEATQSIPVLNFQPLIDAGIAENINRCMQTHQNITEECVYESIWGKKIFVRYHIAPVIDETCTGVQAIVEDRTQQKKNEVYAERRLKYVRTVSACSEFLMTNQSTGEIMHQIARRILNALNMDNVFFYENLYRSLDDITAIHLAEHASHRSQPLYEIEDLRSFRYNSFTPGWEETLSERKSIQENDGNQNTFLRKAKMKSMLLVPIFAGDLWYGFIGTSSKTNRQWDQDEIWLLSTAADMIGSYLIRKWNEEVIRHQAFHDSLTGLPNRIILNDRLKQAMRAAARTNKVVAVLFIDLDHFKEINDSLGHRAGDDLLQMVTERINECLRETDTLIRQGGDEFIALLPALENAEEATTITERIFTQFQDPFIVNNHRIYSTLSIGISVYPVDGHDVDSLLKNADIAMYRAKEEGRNSYYLFDPSMNIKMHQHVSIAKKIRTAIENGDFYLEFQPIFEKVDPPITETQHKNQKYNNAISVIESFIRWNDSMDGQIAPADFLPIAEETGLIVPLNNFILEQACKEATKWARITGHAIPVSINISSVQFFYRDLIDSIKNTLDRTQLDPSLIELEISEDLIVEGNPGVFDNMQALREMGIALSLDDFGTGSSSLTYIKKFPVHGLKIDSSFVADLSHDHEARTITRSIISLANNMNLTVTAEGVETLEQFQFLHENGCKRFQGYFFQHPMQAGELLTYLQS